MGTRLPRTFARPHDTVMFKIGEQDNITLIHPNQVISQSFHVLP